MADNGVVAVGGRLTDWVSVGVLATFVPRDAVDDAVASAGKQAKRSDGKLPPHVMAYFVMALALFAEDDYEEVAARLTETLTAWGCWDDSWSVPTSGGITLARQRLGYEPMKELFAEVAVPVAEEETAGALLGPWRLMAMDGFEWDAPIPKRTPPRSGSPALGLRTRDARRIRRCGWSRSASAPRTRSRMPRWAASRARERGSSRWPASSTGGWKRAGC